MAYPILVNDIIEVRDFQRMNGTVLINVYHYAIVEVSAPVADGVAWLQAFGALLADNATGILSMVQAQAAALNHETLSVQKILPVRYRSVDITTGDIGTVAGAALPQNVSCSVTLYSQVATRHGIGRKEVGGIPSTGIVNGLLTAAQVARLFNYGNTVVQDWAVPGGGGTAIATPILLNRAVPNASLVMSTYTVQGTSRVTRRRTVGVGI